MFLNEHERQRVEDKALEQILKMAQLARVDPDDLGVMVRPIVDPMFDDAGDVPFLKDLGISPA